MELQDEAYKLFFNTKGTRGEIPEALKEMCWRISTIQKSILWRRAS